MKRELGTTRAVDVDLSRVAARHRNHCGFGAPASPLLGPEIEALVHRGWMRRSLDGPRLTPEGVEAVRRAGHEIPDALPEDDAA